MKWFALRHRTSTRRPSGVFFADKLREEPAPYGKPERLERLGRELWAGHDSQWAEQKKVSASTQNQAPAALLFPYRHVPGHETGDWGDVIRARKPRRLLSMRQNLEGKRMPALR